MFWVVVVQHNYCLVNDYVFEKLLFLLNVLLIKSKSVFSDWLSVWKVYFFTINYWSDEIPCVYIKMYFHLPKLNSVMCNVLQ